MFVFFLIILAFNKYEFWLSSTKRKNRKCVVRFIVIKKKHFYYTVYINTILTVNQIKKREHKDPEQIKDPFLVKVQPYTRQFK